MNNGIKNKIWTIGHSTRLLETFDQMLRSFDIECVVDVRSYPGSARFPQYNRENLERSLPAIGIKYVLISELGGRRKVNPNSQNTAWRHPAFRGYADYMETPQFMQGIAELKQMASSCRVAIMCSEAVWWRCHRSMIADCLKSQGWDVCHIMSSDKCTPHPYTAAARIVDGRLSYKQLLPL